MDQPQPTPLPYAPKPQPSGTPMPGSIRLFRALGVDVYLHFSWILVAIYVLTARRHEYHSQLWNVLEYLSLFGIVLMHEYGHALACRSVGGIANRIMLWPIGGIAYVQPPQRAGAMLWSIVAGPLVNVALIPVTVGIWFMAKRQGMENYHPDAFRFLQVVAVTNGIILFFNLLPFYPLDGGQILRSLLWFVAGRANSLMIASIIGLVGAAGLAVLVLAGHFGYLAYFLVAFLGLQSFNGLRQARIMAKMDSVPRHTHVRCPNCGTNPPMAPAWRCEACFYASDLIATGGRCPFCGQVQRVIPCTECRAVVPLEAWGLNPSLGAPLPAYYAPPPGWVPPGHVPRA